MPKTSEIILGSVYEQKGRQCVRMGGRQEAAGRKSPADAGAGEGQRGTRKLEVCEYIGEIGFYVCTEDGLGRTSPAEAGAGQGDHGPREHVHKAGG